MQDSGLKFSHISVELLTARNDLVRIRDEWHRLLSCTSVPVFCLEWAWVATWFDVFKDDGFEPYVIVVRELDQAIGIAPFAIKLDATKAGYRHRRRTLRFAGTGEAEKDEVGTEFADLICHPDRANIVSRYVAEWLVGRGWKDWDVLRLENVLATSHIAAGLLASLERHGCHSASSDNGARFCLDLPSTWAAYLSGQRQSVRYRLVSARRKISKDVPVEVQVAESPAELSAALEIVAQLHTARWNGTRHAGAFSSERFRYFHQTIVERLTVGTRPAIVMLSQQGRNVAATYSFDSYGRTFFYQSGFQLPSSERGGSSPGVAAISFDIERAISRGSIEYDFMRGDLGSYKERFDPRLDAVRSISVFNSHWRGRIAAAVDGVQSLARDKFKALSRIALARLGCSPLFGPALLATAIL